MTRQITIVALFENETTEQTNLVVSKIEKFLATTNQGMYCLCQFYMDRMIHNYTNFVNCVYVAV